ILAAFLVVVVLTAGLGLDAIHDMATLHAASSKIYVDNVLPISELGRIQKHIYRTRVYLLTEFVSTSGSDQKVAADKLAESRSEVATALAAYKRSDLNGRETALGAFEKGWTEYLKIADATEVAARAKDHATVVALLEKAQPTFDALSKAVKDLDSIEQKAAA